MKVIDEDQIVKIMHAFSHRSASIFTKSYKHIP